MELINNALEKETIYIDMDGVIVDFKKGILDGKEKFPKHHYQQSRYGFFIDLEPIDGSIDTVKWLMHHFNVYFLTRPSINNISCYSEKAYWIQKYFGHEALERLIICPNKSLVKGQYLIDDSILNGQDKFEGVLIRFSIDPYFSTWADIKNYFEELI